MIQKFKHGNDTFEVDSQSAKNELKLKIDGDDLKLTLAARNPQEMIFSLDGQSHRGFCVRDKDRVYVHIAGRHFELEDISGADDEAGSGAGGLVENVIAPMPGSIIKVMVEAGQAVETGTPLIIVEAMKMENQVNAPANVTISKVLVEPGQQVGPGEVLIEFEQMNEEEAS